MYNSQENERSASRLNPENVVERYFELNGCSLKCLSFLQPRDGNSLKIIFIAGWVTQINTWLEVLEGLSQHYPVHYLETREKSSSRLPKKVAIGVTAIARDIAEFISKENFLEGQYILIGSSLGATAIVESFRFLQQKPRAAILINTNAVFRVPTIWKIIVRLFYPPLYFLILPVVKWYLKTYRLNVQADPAQYKKYARALDAADPRKLKKAVLAFSGYFIWPALEFVNSPVLLVGASRDKLHEPGQLQRLKQSLAEVISVDLETNEAAHGPKLTRTILEYLTTLE